MAKVMGAPAAFAAMARGRSAFASAATLPLKAALSVMLWPLRLSSHGTTMAFFGEPRRPRVEAIGMPSSMCVAWMSPFESASRMAAQLAPLAIVASIP
jgi:hypothetical protein